MAEKEYEVESIDFSKLLSGLEGMWVIISEDRKSILASGKTLQEISNRISDGLVMKAPHSNAAYSPAFSLR